VFDQIGQPRRAKSLWLRDSTKEQKTLWLSAAVIWGRLSTILADSFCCSATATTLINQNGAFWPTLLARADEVIE
jgi:hypothetical protein